MNDMVGLVCQKSPASNRKLSGIIWCTLLLVSLTSMADSNIVSRPVGVTTVNIPANSQVAASLPYVPFTPTMDALVGGQLTNGAGVLVWDNLTQKYDQVNRVNGRWVQASTTAEVPIVQGDAFWVANGPSNQVLVLGGNLNLTHSNLTLLPQGLSLVGLPQSSGVTVESSGLKGLGKDRLTDSLGNAITNMTPGAAYWYKRNEAGCRAWVEVLPCATDMFPAEGSRPAITDIKVQAPTGGSNSPSVTLAIALDAGCKKIDIYYKDQAAADPLVLDKGWLIAETDLPVQGRATLEWGDAGNSQRKAASEIFARYYLVGNADLLDANGIPLARNTFVFGKGSGLSFNQKSALSGLSSNVSDSLASSFSNSVSPVVKFSPVLARIIFVDRNNGRDQLTGKGPVVVGADGPKKTVTAGLQAAGNEGNTIIIKSGTYGETLNLSGKNVKVIIQGSVKL